MVHGKEPKPFNLKVGDIIRAYDTVADEHRKFEVTGIYPHIFTARRINGSKTTRAFKRSDYELGLLERRVRKNKED